MNKFDKLIDHTKYICEMLDEMSKEESKYGDDLCFEMDKVWLKTFKLSEEIRLLKYHHGD